MDTNPIQRLAYYNGQRLEAADLQLEQHYHIAVRRILTRGLFTPGVVSGFDVQGKTGDAAVTVKAGVALDPCGREIIQVDDQTIAVPNSPPPMPLDGYFLTVAYAESDIPGGNGWCPPSSPEATARIQEGGILDWTPTLPAPMNCSVDSPKDCAIVLAFVAISGCTVQSIILTPRQYAAPAHTSQTQAFALEGEKDIDSNNSKRLYFQIVGGPPQMMTLYLWGDQFSTLYYTELGGHEHTVNKDGSGSVNLNWAHTHDLNSHTHPLDLTTVNLSGGGAMTDPAGDHIHNVNMANTNWQVESFASLGTTSYHLRGRQGVGPLSKDGSTYLSSPVDPNASEPSDTGADPPSNLSRNHVHGLSSVTLTPATGPVGNTKVDTEGPNPTSTASAGSATDTSSITGSTDQTGVQAPQARAGDAYTYIDNLQVSLDGKPITDAVLSQLPGMTSLGNGNAPFPAGPIDLLAVAADKKLSLGEGTHWLDFSVAPGNGGKLLYNLYVR